MKFNQIKKAISDPFELRIADMPDAHRFVEKYLRNLGSLYKIGYSWIDIEEAIADYDELYMKGNELVISSYVDQNAYANLDIDKIISEDSTTIIYLSYESMNKI